MGSRYYVTGVQLGMMLAWTESGDGHKIQDLLNSIEQKQYIGYKENEKKLKAVL